MKNSKNLSLQELEKKLIQKYKSLELEEKNVETVIQCQTRKREIQEQKQEIEQQLYEIKGNLLKESEDYKEKQKAVRNKE